MNRTEPVRVAGRPCIRPLTTSEGCITVTPDEPQVHIGSHTFMYDFVFGNTGLPFSQIYHRCVAPLVEDLFKGYNATILAYGQTASGKTYTMGTNCGTNGGGIIPRVMEDVFTRVETVKSRIRVSFLEIYNEEIYDLLASNPSRAPIIVRKTASGEITLQGVNEVEVKTKEEMSSYLARGSSARATACVSPAITDVEETLHTLRYANCARNIKNKAVVQKQKPSAPCFMFKELTPSKSEAKNKAMVQKHKPSELTPSKSESLPVYDKPVYDKEDVFQDFSELKIPWPLKQLGNRSMTSLCTMRMSLKLSLSFSTMRMFLKLSLSFSAMRMSLKLSLSFKSHLLLNQTMFSEFRKHNTSSLDVSPKNTESEQEDKCQNKPMEIIDLTDDEAEVQEKKPFIDLTTAECHLELKELNKRLEEKEVEIRGSDEEKVQLEKEKRALQREIEGLRQKLRSSCKTARCQCIVANRFCVPSCGCSSIKCSNRSREERLL
ncbi:hypothetical protein Bca52824_089584 [Brassica carinata]|uniref:Kinesin motor domain-containing protein n=1 Tax=Brassica carinata TaxID=52824 RepID=A0A8X7PDJ3_BRACI|nr:hypothetical protein Bca52824_089584 [Brassica carinata]